MSVNLETLIRRNGLYSKHFLITLHDTNNETVLRYVNNNEDIIFNGDTYKAASFNYKANPFILGFDGGGTLEISGVKNRIIDAALIYRTLRLDVTGVINECGEIEQNKKYRHSYGKVKCQKMKLTFTFDRDDRLGMTFPALIWNATNNHGGN